MRCDLPYYREARVDEPASAYLIDGKRVTPLTILASAGASNLPPLSPELLTAVECLGAAHLAVTSAHGAVARAHKAVTAVHAGLLRGAEASAADLAAIRAARDDLAALRGVSAELAARRRDGQGGS